MSDLLLLIVLLPAVPPPAIPLVVFDICPVTCNIASHVSYATVTRPFDSCDICRLATSRLAKYLLAVGRCNSHPGSCHRLQHCQSLRCQSSH